MKNLAGMQTIFTWALMRLFVVRERIGVQRTASGMEWNMSISLPIWATTEHSDIAPSQQAERWTFLLGNPSHFYFNNAGYIRSFSYTNEASTQSTKYLRFRSALIKASETFVNTVLPSILSVFPSLSKAAARYSRHKISVYILRCMTGNGTHSASLLLQIEPQESNYNAHAYYQIQGSSNPVVLKFGPRPFHNVQRPATN